VKSSPPGAVPDQARAARRSRPRPVAWARPTRRPRAASGAASGRRSYFRSSL